MDAQMDAQTYRMELGGRIRALRSEKFGNQRSFAEALGLDTSQMSRIENGRRNVDTRLLRRIADLLQVPVDLLTPHDPPAPALARGGGGEMDGMIEWARKLRKEIDVVSRYAAVEL